MASPELLLHLELRRPNGQTEGPLDLARVEERLYAGELKGDEELRGPDGAWRPLSEWPELAPMMDLLGHRPASRVRWSRSASDAAHRPAPRRSEPASPEAVERAGRIARELPERSSRWPWVVSVIVALVTGLGLYALLG